MLRITRILQKKIQSPDELFVVPRYGLFDLLHGSSQRSEEFDHFNTVFITGSMAPYFPSQIQFDGYREELKAKVVNYRCRSYLKKLVLITTTGG